LAYHLSGYKCYVAADDRPLTAQVTLNLDAVAFAHLSGFVGSRLNNLGARGLQTLPQLAGFCRDNSNTFFGIIDFNRIHNP